MEVLEVDQNYIIDISEGISPNLKDKIYEYIYDRLIEQGIEKGIEKGMEQKTIDVIKNCIKNGLNLSMIANISGLSEDKVVEIVERISNTK